MFWLKFCFLFVFSQEFSPFSSTQDPPERNLPDDAPLLSGMLCTAQLIHKPVLISSSRARKTTTHLFECVKNTRMWPVFVKTNDYCTLKLTFPSTSVAHSPAWSRATDRKPVSLVLFVLLDSSAQSFSSMYCFRFNDLRVCHLSYLHISD